MSNQFDSIGADPHWTDDENRQFERLDHLIHKLFAQTDEGRELMDLWVDALIKTPTADHGQDLLTIGINEGKKSFIRGIILTIEKVENE